MNGKILKFGTKFQHFYNPLPVLTEIMFKNKFQVG